VAAAGLCCAAADTRETPRSAAAAETPAKPAIEAPARLEPKVLVINYDPAVPGEGGKRLHEVVKWTDPRYLCEAYAADLRESSGGYVRYRIAEWKDVDAFPVKKDGFRYTIEEYMACTKEPKRWHQPDAVDYTAIIREQGLERRVAAREVDEVWLMGPPYAGFWESTMAGPGAYFCNSGPVPDIDSKRLFIIMGFNYERGVGEMLEDFGHRTESILHHVYGSWEPKPTHAWNRFTLYDKVAPGQAACGNVHFAPNSQGDYDWGHKAFVPSTCDDWLDYPTLAGRKRLVTADDWGGGNIRAHHNWWFRHLPRSPGRTDGKLNNWWAYVADPNPYPESNH
jgi:hypothetical protein